MCLEAGDFSGLQGPLIHTCEYLINAPRAMEYPQAISDHQQFLRPGCQYLISSNPLYQKLNRHSESPSLKPRQSRLHRLFSYHSLLTHLRAGMVGASSSFCPFLRNAKESPPDCLRFQEALLAQKVNFVAGIAEAKSKGRGEECISQNLRVLQARNGIQTIIFFANSQRKERKRYISIPGKG